MKRILPIIIILALLLCSCKANPSDMTASELDSSINIICEKMELERAAAMDVLEILCDLGLDGQIEYIYVDTDADGNSFYKVWYGLHLMKVYVKDGEVEKVFMHQEMIYPDLPEESGGDNDSSNSNNQSQTGKPSYELDVELISKTSPIKAGSTATVEIKGDPNTEYSIVVEYSSGPSSASGLEPKRSDESGYVSWSWRVSGSVKPGNYVITISAKNKSFKTELIVEE